MRSWNFIQFDLVLVKSYEASPGHVLMPTSKKFNNAIFVKA
ncbi:hypothetical protein COO91_07333 [Nostoc flagelliforme CCNUN1]|uniref:Uncharacterized protein n=1 Tax=Nostoc flagelliforme CCNUN1 TaxID=2038116 RepID=A0A2K8T2P1_9NOSO|nr:hypothetical protein COO91_07333 [Nostoc flagelliforme CCNUN1]